MLQAAFELKSLQSTRPRYQPSHTSTQSFQAIIHKLGHDAEFEKCDVQRTSLMLLRTYLTFAWPMDISVSVARNVLDCEGEESKQ